MKLNDKKFGKIFAEPNRTEPAKISRTPNRTESKFRSFPKLVKIEIELGIFFFRYYDVFLCADHRYAKIKKSVSIKMV